MDRFEWDAFHCERLNETEKGKMVLCESREDGSTRLFVHRFSRWVSLSTKEGWWDTFTISKAACNKGFWLCVIDSFRIDRNGYLNMIVNPKKNLGEAINEESIAWDFFFSLGIFCSEYTTKHFCERFNTTNLFSLFEDEFPASEKKHYFAYVEKGEHIFNKFLNDEIDLTFIEKALDEKDSVEKLCDEILACLRTGRISDKFVKYELIFKKLPNNVAYLSASNIEYWLTRKDIEYMNLKLGNETYLLDRVEAVLRYWVDKNNRDKEARKAARKAKKNKSE